MIKLIRLNEDTWLICSASEGVYEKGNMGQALDILKYLGVEQSEIEAALDSMLKDRHNTAEFGLNRIFIFSKFQALAA